MLPMQTTVEKLPPLAKDVNMMPIFFWQDNFL